MPRKENYAGKRRGPNRTPAAEAILSELVSRPSVHPEGDAGGTPPGEAAVAAWLVTHLRRLGAGVETRLLAPGRPSVLAVFQPAGRPAQTVVLAPHLDTVGVTGMSLPPFRLTRFGSRLQGRGACDTKGPTAALLAAFGRWVRLPAHRRGATRWVLAATAGEEQGSLGAEQLLAGGLRADFAVALEPTGLRVVSAAKGILRVWIDVPGRAAHGARPERGVNAVAVALPLVRHLMENLAPRLARLRHPLLGPASLNLGIVRGGTELNLVPAACRLGLDIRVHPGCPGPRVLGLLREAMARHAPTARLTIHREGPAFVTSRTDLWARRLRTHGRGWAKADWFCDANLFAGHGIPAVAFGPGDIRQAHTRDEYIERRELTAGTEAFRGFLSS